MVHIGFCGVMSIFSSMRYCLGPPSAYANLWAALAFMPFGLFFDFMDGKVARWRKKSSLMGQELDSLADLVRSCPHPYTESGSSLWEDLLNIAVFGLGLIRRLPRCCSLRHRPPHPRRPPPAHLLRALRPHAPSPLQHHRSQRTQGRHREVAILRRHADPHLAVHRSPDGILGLAGLDPG